MNKNLLDSIQLQRLAFDAEKEAYKVSLTPIELEVNLDAFDGDSVQVFKNIQVIEFIEEEIVLNTSLFSSIFLLSDDLNAQVELRINLTDFNKEFSLGICPLFIIKEICAPSLKCKKQSTAPVYIILKS